MVADPDPESFRPLDTGWKNFGSGTWDKHAGCAMYKMYIQRLSITSLSLLVNGQDIPYYGTPKRKAIADGIQSFVI